MRDLHQILRMGTLGPPGGHRLSLSTGPPRPGRAEGERPAQPTARARLCRRPRHHLIERDTTAASATRSGTPSSANTCRRRVFTVCGEMYSRPPHRSPVPRPPAVTPPRSVPSGCPSRPATGAGARAGEGGRPGPATAPGPRRRWRARLDSTKPLIRTGRSGLRDRRMSTRLIDIPIRRSDFLPEQWKRLHTSADRVERTVRKYAWLCIKRAPG
jgi:hypothetical protein